MPTSLAGDWETCCDGTRSANGRISVSIHMIAMVFWHSSHSLGMTTTTAIEEPSSDLLWLAALFAPKQPVQILLLENLLDDGHLCVLGLLALLARGARGNGGIGRRRGQGSLCIYEGACQGRRSRGGLAVG